VAAWLSEVIGEIVDRYPVAGVHLDYVRYPHERTGFHPEAVQRFQAQYGFDPVWLYTRSGDGDSGSVDEGLDSLKQVWIQWRCQQVTETVRMIRDRLGPRSPRVLLSAAVKPDHERAVERYGQDWKTWMEQDLLDFVVVMAYSPATEEVVRQVGEARRLLQGRPLFAGIGIYNQPSSTTVEQIEAVRRIGIHGISLFSYTIVAEDDEYLRTLREDCFGRSSPGTAGEE
jgi:uncharacterized lipoprotein YddW (UPF0748 family)